MKLAVIGSRSITDAKIINDLLRKHHESNPVTELISGGAAGVDTIAANWSRGRRIKTTEIRPNYKKMGKRAPPARNEQIIRAADLVLAIWDGKSAGTLHAITYAKKIGTPVSVTNLALAAQVSLF